MALNSKDRTGSNTPIADELEAEPAATVENDTTTPEGSGVASYNSDGANAADGLIEPAPNVGR